MRNSTRAEHWNYLWAGIAGTILGVVILASAGDLASFFVSDERVQLMSHAPEQSVEGPMKVLLLMAGCMFTVFGGGSALYAGHALATGKNTSA